MSMADMPLFVCGTAMPSCMSAAERTRLTPNAPNANAAIKDEPDQQEQCASCHALSSQSPKPVVADLLRLCRGGARSS